MVVAVPRSRSIARISSAAALVSTRSVLRSDRIMSRVCSSFAATSACLTLSRRFAKIEKHLSAPLGVQHGFAR
jgi:hypothetical protein